MSEINSDKILIQLNNSFDNLGYIIPTYMRNANNMIQTKDLVSRVSWEKEGMEILNENKMQLSQKERKIIKLLILKGVPQERRGDLWFISSGAKMELKNNPGYYDFLLNKYPQDIELPSDRQIDLDINRTFPSDPFFQDGKNLRKLKNVLLCYSRRNISIGYVQGFNFIVGRLLKIIHNEEEIFWIFSQIVENILPLNFYSEMAGLMIDIDILINLIQNYYPELIQHLDENYLLEYFKNILFKWFISLFIENFSYEVHKHYLIFIIQGKSCFMGFNFFRQKCDSVQSSNWFN